MYNTINIYLLDQHTHRFLWRDMNTSVRSKIYAMTVVTFGDNPAVTITIVALRKTAQMGAQTYPDAARTITENIYVGDILWKLLKFLHAALMKCYPWDLSR